MKIYLLSGLGADERLFKNLRPIAGYEFVPLAYPKPGKCKTLAEYAALLVKKYKFKAPFMIGGVSIGGMLAQEVAQIVRPEKLILISTIRFRNEFPPFLRMVDNGFTRRLLVKSFLEVIAGFGDKFTHKSPEGRALFYDMLHASDPDFLKFGAGATLAWQPPHISVPFVRFHGSADKVFPISRIKGCIEIKNGGHFMIYEKGDQISEILTDRLAKFTS